MTVAINLGGTIALGYINDKPVYFSGKQLADNADFHFVEVNPVQSQGLNWSHLRDCRSVIAKHYNLGERKFIVFSGTASADDFLYYLSLVRPPDASIVLMVSMRTANVSDPTPDGLKLALNWLNQCNKNVALCWGPQIIEGGLSEKVYSEQWVFKEVSHTKQLPNFNIDISVSLPEEMPLVHILSSSIGMVDFQKNIINSKNYDGLVLDSYPGGNIHPDVAEALKEPLALDIPVVLSSRAKPGIVVPAFPNIPGASHDLFKSGVLGALQLNAYHARMRLLMALCINENASNIFCQL